MIVMNDRLGRWDCGEEGCGECAVCRYLDFLDFVSSCAPLGSVIGRDRNMEAYLKAIEAKP